jgi:hypothetical protein
MSFSPPTLIELQVFLAPRTGLSAGNLGIVGDAAHIARGVSYHLGRDHLKEGAYSRKSTRDRGGLTNAASALDIGNHPDLRRLSVDLVAACRADAPGTDDIREVIYSPDGKKVLRWDRERGFDSKPRRGEADDSHLFHTHVSWYRNSEGSRKVGVFAALYGEGEAEVPLIDFTLAQDEKGGTIKVKKGGATVITIDGGDRPLLKAGMVRPALGPATLKIRGELQHYMLFIGTKEIGFVSENEVEFTPSTAG